MDENVTEGENARHRHDRADGLRGAKTLTGIRLKTRFSDMCLSQIAKRKKWRHFVQRWFVVGPGRLEMYANEASVNLDDFISIVPLESCEILDNPKKKRSDAPLSFRINVNNSAQAK
eukprot:COSAG05_NODE_10365_length_569_cov_1.195745_1_plen_117_part_00